MDQTTLSYERQAEDDTLYLRLLTADDVTDEYIGWFKDTDVTQFLDSKDLTKQDVVEYIERGHADRRHFMYGIFDVRTDRHFGNMKIGPIQWSHGVADMVCVIGRKEYWGKGLAKKAIRLGNKIAFNTHDLRKLSGGMATSNIGSFKAYTGAGWVEEGRLRGHNLIDGEAQDRILVSCFNPAYFGGDS